MGRESQISPTLMRVSSSQKTVENSRKVQELAFSQLLALGFCNPKCINLSLSLQLGFCLSVIQFLFLPWNGFGNPLATAITPVTISSQCTSFPEVLGSTNP